MTARAPDPVIDDLDDFEEEYVSPSAAPAARPRARKAAAPISPELPPVRYRRAKRVGWAVLFVALFSAPWWGPRLLSQLAFFRVRRVEVLGAQYLAPGDLLARLRVDTTVSVWDDFAPIAARVAEHPQLERIEIGRRLPGTLVVTITERLPVALVPSPSGFRAFDARGVPLPIDPARTPVDAPILASRDTAMLRLLGSLRARAPGLYGRVSEARRAAKDELLFHLAALPVRTMADVTVERFAEVEPVERDLARRQRRAAEIDLRFRDQVIARIQ